jgi:Na+/H+ antiporter NhaD/arsenite permease-like protein
VIYIPFITLILVLFVIAIRPLIPIKISIWQVMLVGGLVVLATGSIHIHNAIKSLNWDVLGFLFGAFIIAEALESSGYLDKLLNKVFGKINSGFIILFLLMLISAIGSALFMNDTIAIIGVPIILYLIKKHENLKWPLFFGLAFSITIGSNLSPIGNPQNLLIANSGLTQPFVSFMHKLWLPSFINLAIAFVYLSLIFKKDLSHKLNKNKNKNKTNTHTHAQDTKISIDSIVSLFSGALLILLIIISAIFNHLISFSILSIIACLPILLFSKNRFKILKKIDWGTLIFFVSLFILIASVWDSGVLQQLVNKSGNSLLHLPVLMGVSVLVSQLISNVPLVALYLPILHTHHANLDLYLALAASSTIAGNLCLMGAASNIIILQRLEKTNNFKLKTGYFFLIGAPLVLINLLVYYFI